MPDFFEIERLVEDLAKIYSTACATTWFKLEKVKHPSREEFRSKVVEFMKHFNYTLSVYQAGQESDNFRSYASRLLQLEIERILSGNNKEVEKRYKYYVDYA
jgi:hypothetical protein